MVSKQEKLLHDMQRLILNFDGEPNEIPAPDRLIGMVRRTVEQMQGGEIEPTEGDFEEFYLSFPAPRDKELARKQYALAFARVKRRTGVHPAKVLQHAAKEYAHECKRTKLPGAKVTWPQKWLADDTWWHYWALAPRDVDRTQPTAARTRARRRANREKQAA